MWGYSVLVASMTLVSVAVLVLGRVDEQQSEPNEILKWRPSLHKGGNSRTSGCECIRYDCGCCLDVDIPKIGLDDTVCANVSYLPDQYGVSVTVDIDGKVIINETISVKNPPPICVGVPYLEKEASVCLDLYNLDVTKEKFSGCIALEARLYHVFVEKVELGCFSMPLAGRGRVNIYSDAEWVKAVAIKKAKVLGVP